MERTSRTGIIGTLRSFFLRRGGWGEREYFIENLGMLLASGMDIGSALRAVKGELRTRAMRAAAERIGEDIEAGLPLWRALESVGFLPAYVISLVRVGEENGRLPQNLQIIVGEQQKLRLFRAKLRSAMVYPILVFLLTLVLGVAIAWFILPRLAAVFKQLDIALPVVTRALMALGAFLGAYGSLAVPAAVLIIAVLAYIVFLSPRTKFLGQVFLFSFPEVKKLIREIELARFGFVLGTLLEAGLPIVPALQSLHDATQFYAYKKFYRHLTAHIEEGSTFHESFRSYPKSRKLVPVPVQELIASAEQSGKMPETLRKIGETYEAKTEITTKNLTVVLEPILLIIVWIGVVAVALAVILPIYSLIGGLNP